MKKQVGGATSWAAPPPRCAQIANQFGLTHTLPFYLDVDEVRAEYGRKYCSLEEFCNSFGQ